MPRRAQVRQEIARGQRRSGELIAQRAPADHESAHAHEDPDLVSKIAPLPQKYNYKTPCFRDLQTQNAYLRGRLGEGNGVSGGESELDYYKGQVHELTVHRAVLHKENERLLAERRAVEEAAIRNANAHDKHIVVSEQAARLRVQLADALALNASLAAARTAEQVRAQSLERELASMEVELNGLAAKHRQTREEAAGTAHQLRQAHALLSKTQEVRARRRHRAPMPLFASPRPPFPQG